MRGLRGQLEDKQQEVGLGLLRGSTLEERLDQVGKRLGLLKKKLGLI